MMNHSGCNRNQKQLDSLMALDFAIQETVLFLDAYPECLEALTYYHNLINQRKDLLANYETNGTPLSIYGNRNSNAWDWVKEPWPWEAEAN